MKTSAYTKLNDQFWIDQTKVIGTGQYSRVYKGYYSTLDEIIAIKLIPQNLIKQSDWQRQVQVMQKLQKHRHPNILQYYGYLQSSQGIYFFIEYCQNGSLCQYIVQSGSISQIKVLQILLQILKAMDHLNKQNILHRDLKPDNILFDQDYNVKLADFGLARFSQVQMTKATGTPIYEAPEMLLKLDYDMKCDVWSAGIILYEMLTGLQYFHEVRNLRQLEQAMFQIKSGERTIKYPKQLQPQWSKITNYMVCYDKERRPSFEEVLNFFLKFYPGMKKKINSKYSYQNQDFDNLDGLSIVQSINPYTNLGGPSKQMQQKIEEQQSYKNLNEFRKYENYFRLKCDFLISLTKQFNTNPYPYAKNVYKYVLIFLSYSIYICRVRNHINELTKIRLILPDKILLENDFKHKEQLINLIEQFKNKYQRLLKRIQDILIKQINWKILNQYQKRPQQSKSLEKISSLFKLDICECIKDVNNKKFLDEEKYVNFYKKLISICDVYISSDKLLQFEKKDVKTYGCIRLVAHIDNVLDDRRYKQDDYIFKIKQEIELKTKQQLIKMISTMN